MDLVSIIVPTFNRLFDLKLAIQSVNNQTYKNIELIIIDNFSDDGTKEFISSLKSPSIQFYQVKNNGIIGLSRNFGINKARGKYVAFLDSDDKWSNDKLELSIQALKDNNADFLYSNFLEVSNGFELKIRVKNISSDPLNFLLSSGNPIATSTVVLKRDILKEDCFFSEDRDKVAWEDYYLWLKIAENGYKFCKLNRFSSMLTKNENNLSNNSIILKNNKVVSKYLYDRYSIKPGWLELHALQGLALSGTNYKTKKLAIKIMFKSKVPILIKLKALRIYILTFI